MAPPAETQTKIEKTIEPLRYCLYARKSSEEDERQAMSIDSQVKEMLELAAREGIAIEEILRESHSAKSSAKRPVFLKMIKEIEDGRFNAILTWAPDRLSRNAGDLGSLVDLMDRGYLHRIRTHGQAFTNSPNEKFLLMILCSQAKLENDNRGLNVQRGQRTRAQMGYRPCMAPLGYLHERPAGASKSRVILDPERGPIIRDMFEQVAMRGASGRSLYDWLFTEKKLRTRKGKKVTLSMIYRMLRNPYYTGKFQWGETMVKGDYEPLVTQETFDEVQKLLTLNTVHTKQWGSKDFAFVRMMTCGACGSGVTAEEKFKKLKDGTVRRYVYYRCTHGRNFKCSEPAIREDHLIEQMLELLDKVNLSRAGVKKKVDEEFERFTKFASDVLGIKENKKTQHIDQRKYAEYLLRNGSAAEKRGLLTCLKDKIALVNGKIEIKA